MISFVLSSEPPSAMMISAGCVLCLSNDSMNSGSPLTSLRTGTIRLTSIPGILCRVHLQNHCDQKFTQGADGLPARREDLLKICPIRLNVADRSCRISIHFWETRSTDRIVAYFSFFSTQY